MKKTGVYMLITSLFIVSIYLVACSNGSGDGRGDGRDDRGETDAFSGLTDLLEESGLTDILDDELFGHLDDLVEEFVREGRDFIESIDTSLFDPAKGSGLRFARGGEILPVTYNDFKAAGYTTHASAQWYGKSFVSFDIFDPPEGFIVDLDAPGIGGAVYVSFYETAFDGTQTEEVDLNISTRLYAPNSDRTFCEIIFISSDEARGLTAREMFDGNHFFLEFNASMIELNEREGRASDLDRLIDTLGVPSSIFGLVVSGWYLLAYEYADFTLSFYVLVINNEIFASYYHNAAVWQEELGLVDNGLLSRMMIDSELLSR